MRRLALIVLILLAPLAAAAPARAFDEADLRHEIARTMRHAGHSAGAYVSEAASGRTIYGLRDTTGRIPASVEKLYTTGTALLTLGPTARLLTTAVTGGSVDSGGVLHGDLAIIGHGDPLFGDGAAARLARAVRRAGIRRIDGGVVGDETYFDHRRSGISSGYDGDLGGVLSALAFDHGIYGGRVQLDAARFAARRFAAALQRAGVRSSRGGRAGTAPAGAARIAAVRSMTIAALARATNVPSNNFAAEMLLKGLGARYGGGGTTSAGAAFAKRTLAAFGVTPRITDGSGLSRADRTSPRQVVGLLDHMAAEPAGAAFRASLAVAGRTGTVSGRMRGTPAAGNCRLKTGTLHDVSSLAGYCRARDGRDITFALLMNDVTPYRARALQDRIAIAIARMNDPDATQPPAAAAPSGGAAP